MLSLLAALGVRVLGSLLGASIWVPSGLQGLGPLSWGHREKELALRRKGVNP